MCSIAWVRGPFALAAVLLFAGLSCGRTPEAWRGGLDSADAFERGLCALALARTDPGGCDAALPRLLELVDGGDEAMAEAARAELARIAPLHVPALIENFCTVEDASHDFRSALRAALVAAGEAAVPALRERLVDSGKASNPREIGLVLVELGPCALEPLLTDLVDPQARRRVAAVWTIGRMDSRAQRAVPALERVLAEDAAPIAQQAALALARIAPADEGVRAALQGALERRPAECAAAAREALAEIELARAAQQGTRPALARLFALGAPALGPAVEACAAKDPARRALGAHFLGARFALLALGLDAEEPDGRNRGDDLPRLQQRLDDKDAVTRAGAALELARRGTVAAPYLGALAEHAFDPHPGVALESRLALLHLVRALALESARRRSR